MAEPPALDAPVAGLGDAEALAKAWLLELIAARPLGEAARLPTERLGTDGPALVAAVIGALVSDRELERLSPEGDLSGLAAAAGSIAGAGGPAEVVAALERLRSVVWAAIERTAPGSPPLHLAGRLAHVCGKVAEAALAADDSRAAPAEPPRDDVGAADVLADSSSDPRERGDGLVRAGQSHALRRVQVDEQEGEAAARARTVGELALERLDPQGAVAGPRHADPGQLVVARWLGGRRE